MKVRGAMSVGPVVLLLLATVGCCCCVGAAPAAGDTPVGGDVPCDWTAFSTHMTQMGRSCCEAGASCDRSGMPLGDGCVLSVAVSYMTEGGWGLRAGGWGGEGGEGAGRA
eukprot:COSAG01_NODE_507_length_16108_cov_18.603973_1_plen_110_part_00